MKKLLLLLSFIYVAQINAQVCFNAAINYGMGTNSAITADFNNDGKIDIAAADYSNNRIFVGINSGTGSFAGSFYPVGTDPLSITSADFNNDGYLDLAVANNNGTGSGSSSLSILLNTGTGSFGAASSLVSGVNPWCIISADFNADGKADLAVANYTSNNIAVYLGTGTGSFGSATGYTVSSPKALVSADFNNDGKLDLVVGNSNPGLTVFLGTGTGTFGSATSIPTGGGGIFLTINDFNGDGNMDVASDAIAVSLGTGTGNFLPAATYTAHNQPWGITSGDFNGDSKLDLAVANYNSNDASILLGTGNGTFGLATNFVIAASARSIASGDFDGDGKLDLVTNTSRILNCTPTSTCVTSLTVNSTASICVGGSVTLTASGSVGSTFNWVPATGLNVTTGSVVVASPTTSITYTVIGNTTTCAPGAATSIVTVNSTPTISVSQNNIICPGATSTLCASGAVTYTWVPYLLNGYVGTCMPINTPGNYTVQGTDANGCVSSTSTNVQIVPNPTVSISATPLNCSSLCEVFMSTVSTPSTSTYMWDYGDGPVVAGSANPSHCYSNPITTVASLTVTNGNGCVGTATTNVNVNPTAPINLSVSASTYTICAGGTATLTATGATTYSWYPTGSTAAVNVVTPGTTTTFTAYGSNGTCTDSATVTVFVNPTPTVSISYIPSVCSSTCTAFSSTISPSPNGSTYMWNFGDGSLSTAATPCHFYSIPGTYSVYLTVTDANGCVGTGNSMVNISPTPTLSIGATASSFCTPACVTYTANVSSVPAIQTYSWTLDNGLFSPFANPPTVCYPVGFTGAQVTLTVTDVNGCVATATTSIIINPTPSATLVPGNVRCNGLCNGVITFSVTGGTTPYMYLGTMGNPTQPVQNNLCAGNYTCFVQDANNCTDTVTVSITEPPTLTLTVNQTNVSCNGMCDVTATLNVNGGSGPYTYNWATFSGTQPVTGAVCAGTYTCHVTDANGCTDSITTTITQPTPIVATYTLVQDTAPHVWDVYPSFTGGTQPYTYSWNWGDGTTSNGAYPSHTYSVAATYSICVTVTDVNACTSQTYCQNDSVYRLSSSSTMITVNVINGTAPTGIKNISIKNEINIYPNPAQNYFTVEVSTNEKQTLQLFDVNGKQVLSQTINGTTNIDASNLNAGVYSLSVASKEGVVNKKLVIVK